MQEFRLGPVFVVISLILNFGLVNSAESKRELFDLAYTFDDDTIFFPGQRFNYQLNKDIGPTVNFTSDGHRYTYAMFSFCVAEHGGTHIDAPYHWNDKGWRTAEIPIERLVDVPAVVVDVDHLVFALPHPETFTLEPQHFIDHEAKYGRIPDGAVVMIRFGWGKFWPDKQKFMGLENTTDPTVERPPLHMPGMSGNGATWLLNERKVIGYGADTLSADQDQKDNPVHRILQQAQVYLIENIANLDNLVKKTRPNITSPNSTNKPCIELKLTVLPVKTLGTGGPVRLVARCKD